MLDIMLDRLDYTVNIRSPVLMVVNAWWLLNTWKVSTCLILGPFNWCEGTRLFLLGWISIHLDVLHLKDSLLSVNHCKNGSLARSCHGESYCNSLAGMIKSHFAQIQLWSGMQCIWQEVTWRRTVMNLLLEPPLTPHTHPLKLAFGWYHISHTHDLNFNIIHASLFITISPSVRASVTHHCSSSNHHLSPGIEEVAPLFISLPFQRSTTVTAPIVPKESHSSHFCCDYAHDHPRSINYNYCTQQLSALKYINVAHSCKIKNV